MKVAVVAGTPVDTQLGIDYLKKKNSDIETVFVSMGANPRETHIFQMSDRDTKIKVTKEHFKPLVDEGIRNFFVYCNSLSATVDYESIAAELRVNIVTPKNAYIKLAQDYDNAGVIAANNHSTEWIETICTAVNPQCYICGTGYLKLVEAVESKMDPAAIVKDYDLKSLCMAFKAAGCQILVLGCTHFPYFKEEIKAVTDLTVFDPADIMYEDLLNNYIE